MEKPLVINKKKHETNTLFRPDPMGFFPFRAGSDLHGHHLRGLDSITEEEAREIYTLLYPDIDRGYDNYLEDWWHEIDEGYCRNVIWFIGNPKVWLHLLSKGFDLFGLIDAGEAIDINANQEIP